jgi:hypothetical protein
MIAGTSQSLRPLESEMLRAIQAATALSFIALAGCLSASDVPSTPQEPTPIPSTSAIQIVGIEKFHKVADVVSVMCRNNKFETDRRLQAQSGIQNTLTDNATAIPGGLRFEVQSLELRVRCFDAQCISDATLAAVASGKDKQGNEIRVEATGTSSQFAGVPILCNSAMPAVTRSVDEALGATLVDMKRRLSSRTGAR